MGFGRWQLGDVEVPNFDRISPVKYHDVLLRSKNVQKLLNKKYNSDSVLLKSRLRLTNRRFGVDYYL